MTSASVPYNGAKAAYNISGKENGVGVWCDSQSHPTRIVRVLRHGSVNMLATESIQTF